MSTSYEVRVKMTSRAVRSCSKFELFDSLTKVCETLAEVKEWLELRYPKGTKRHKMFQEKYIDGFSKKDTHIGFVYSFHYKDAFDKRMEWMQEDWVEIREIKSTVVII